MLHRSLLRFSIALAPLALIVCSIALQAQDSDSHHGRKYKAPPPAAHIEVTVLKADNGKPITDAHVIFHPVEGDKDKGSMELKTNEDGKTIIDVIPIGDTVRLQVIANGYQTYGQDYIVDKPRMTMEVRLKRPGAQYSIYKNNTAKSSPENPSTNPPANSSTSDKDSGSGNSSDTSKSSNSSQNTAPPASADKSSGSASQPDPPPNESQSKPQSN